MILAVLFTTPFIFPILFLLSAVHRLDRMTSGLLMLAKSLQRAQQLEVEIRERRVSKEYLCRVQGEFPRCLNLFFSPRNSLFLS